MKLHTRFCSDCQDNVVTAAALKMTCPIHGTKTEVER